MSKKIRDYAVNGKFPPAPSVEGRIICTGSGLLALPTEGRGSGFPALNRRENLGWPENELVEALETVRAVLGAMPRWGFRDC